METPPRKKQKRIETDIIDVAHSVDDLCYKIDDLQFSGVHNASFGNLIFAGKELGSLQEIVVSVFERCDSKLARDIEDAASGLTKSYESYVSESESHGDGIQTDINLEQEIHSVFERVKTIKAKMKEYDDADSPRIGSDGQKSKIIGFSDLYRRLTDRVLRSHPHRKLKFVSIYGMGGIGKTTLAKEFFDNPFTSYHFNCRVWVEVGRNRQLKKIIRNILAQVNPRIDQILLEGDDNISDYVEDSLRGRRYLIVLDDVWDKWVKTEIVSLLPEESNSSLVLLTTRLEAIANQNCKHVFSERGIEMRLLDKKESWNLLHEKVFGEEQCPYQLEKAGKKIAKHCDGLPLTIVTVAALLSKAERTPQYWNEVAAKKNHQLFEAAYDEISEVLLPSYMHLNQILQMCFLYMGVFPKNYEIPRSKLVTMWCTDGFLELNLDKFSDSDARDCLGELVSNSLVMIYKSTNKKWPMVPRKHIKTCRLNSSLWHLAIREAQRTKFCRVIISANDVSEEDIKGQPRLSFHNNILLGIKDVYELVEDNCASTAHSLLFYGPYHQYQVPICFSLKLLKQLDALVIRFYKFPVEILLLVELRYLALTVNGKLPASICQLSNLQVLIVGQHMSIKSYRAPSYLPVEIWSIKELQHLQVMGCDLPDPPSGASLESLSTLSDVSPLSCTEVILKAIPNLEKLGIRVELAPGDDGKPLNHFDNIFYLESLKSLKCVLENPEVALPLAPLSIFSSCLERLSLSGLGYSWEEMSKLSLLPSLKVLKLRNYAFRGPKWEMEGGFSSLCSLLIEDTDLEEWKIGAERFRNLNYLIIRYCYKLEKIHGRFENLRTIELIDCNPLGVKQMEIRKPWLWTTVVKFSWNDGN